jgi:hypothetical protein
MSYVIDLQNFIPRKMIYTSNHAKVMIYPAVRQGYFQRPALELSHYIYLCILLDDKRLQQHGKDYISRSFRQGI